MAHSIVLPKLYFRSSTYLMLILPIYLFLNVYLRALSRALLTTSTYLCYDIYNYARTYFYYFKLFPARCTFLRRFGGSFTKRLNCLRGSCSDVATIVRIAKDILPNSQFISIYIAFTEQTSVTRLDDFCKFLAVHFLTNVAVNIWSLFGT